MAQKDQKTALVLATVAIGMVALSFASVPLYRLFCQATGFGGTPQRVTDLDVPSSISDHQIEIHFNADTGSGLDWTFQPLQRSIQAPVGQTVVAYYHAKNLSAQPITGTATYNVVPDQTGRYFNKVDCFCFEEQTLQPGQETDFPVFFYIDPDFIKDANTRDISTITLSYTFFPVVKKGEIP